MAPLVALIDEGEPDHQACVGCMRNPSGPMITTWPVFTEAMYLLAEADGWRAQDALWAILQKRDLEVVLQSLDQYRRMRVLMEKYRDHPMDLADASLVCLAEERRLREVFTLDEDDFRTYRIHGRQTFRLWPRSDRTRTLWNYEEHRNPAEKLLVSLARANVGA